MKGIFESDTKLRTGNDTALAEVAGLISVANLNSRPVQTYLYMLLNDLELELGDFVLTNVPEQTRLDTFTRDDRAAKYQETRKRYIEGRHNGVDATLTSYLYLSDLCALVKAHELHSALAYSSKTRFDVDFKGPDQLRHQVAHPGRSIIGQSGDVSMLWGRIQGAENLLGHLRSVG